LKNIRYAIYMQQSDVLPENSVLIPISLGELLDRVSILELKQQRISDSERRLNVTREFTLLTRILQMNGFVLSDAALQPLREVNTQLWDLENRIRLLDREGNHDGEFIQVAREIHRLNDIRHELKHGINLACGSSVVEEKEYSPEP
jgi:hypothetical protein